MDGHPSRVLLVDDEGPLLHSLRQALLANGVEAHAVTDGEQGWEAIRSQPYDLVVSDLRMPRVDGAELLRRIHEAEIATRVMVITGHASLDAAVDCLRKGAVDFLVKPFPVEVFLASVARALKRPIPRPPGEEPDWDEVVRVLQLTPRQREVLCVFYRKGGSNRELSRELHITPSTVKSHLKVVFLRAEVTNRTQLLQYLREFIR